MNQHIIIDQDGVNIMAQIFWNEMQNMYMCQEYTTQILKTDLECTQPFDVKERDTAIARVGINVTNKGKDEIHENYKLVFDENTKNEDFKKIVSKYNEEEKKKGLRKDCNSLKLWPLDEILRIKKEIAKKSSSEEEKKLKELLKECRGIMKEGEYSFDVYEYYIKTYYSGLKRLEQSNGRFGIIKYTKESGPELYAYILDEDIYDWRKSKIYQIIINSTESNIYTYGKVEFQQMIRRFPATVYELCYSHMNPCSTVLDYFFRGDIFQKRGFAINHYSIESTGVTKNPTSLNVENIEEFAQEIIKYGAEAIEKRFDKEIDYGSGEQTRKGGRK